MENINYSLVLIGNDFKEIKHLSKLLYISLKAEGFDASLLIKPMSNISNFSLTHSLIKVGKYNSFSCSYDINAIISLDFQSILNFIHLIGRETLIISNYSSFNACNFFLADNESVYEKLKGKTDYIYRIPASNLVEQETMGKERVSPFISLIGAFAAKGGILDIGSICGQAALFSRNDREKENNIKALLAGYDYLNEGGAEQLLQRP